METLRQALFMIRADMRGDKKRLLVFLLMTVIVNFYLAFALGLSTESVIFDSDRTDGWLTRQHILLDFLYMAIMPILGFFFTPRSFRAVSDDSYTRMLAYFTSLPITAEVILCKRILQAFAAFALNGLLYFGIISWLSTGLREMLQLSGMLVFTLTWIGFGMILNGLYIAIELLLSGKLYFLLTFFLTIGAFGSAYGLYLADVSWASVILTNARDSGFASPVMWAMLLLGCLSIWLSSRFTLRKLKRRDLQ
jgi:hypothetical protein